MAFFLPRFNVWCRVYRYYADYVNSYKLYGYSLCQVRGTDSKQEAGPIVAGMSCQILLPKWSDVRGHNQDNLPGQAQDIIQVAGWGSRGVYVLTVADKGAGFTNEYRLANCAWVKPPLGDVWEDQTPLVVGMGAVKTDLLPPTVFTPLPLIEPENEWPPATS